MDGDRVRVLETSGVIGCPSEKGRSPDGHWLPYGAPAPRVKFEGLQREVGVRGVRRSGDCGFDVFLARIQEKWRAVDLVTMIVRFCVAPGRSAVVGGAHAEGVGARALRFVGPPAKRPSEVMLAPMEMA